MIAETALVDYAFNQLFLYDSTIETPAYSAAITATESNNISVGAAQGVVHLRLPRDGYRTAPVSLRVHPLPPPFDRDATHAVEFELSVPFGELRLEGGGGCRPTDFEVPARVYRGRWCELDDTPDQERFTLELWPADVPQPPADLRRPPTATGVTATGEGIDLAARAGLPLDSPGCWSGSSLRTQLCALNSGSMRPSSCSTPPTRHAALSPKRDALARASARGPRNGQR